MGVSKEICKQQALTRLGETRIMSCGEIAFIIEYINATNIKVQFKTTKEIVNTTYLIFINGNVKSHFTPSVYGVGIVGLEKATDINNKNINSYRCWHSMLTRCYTGKYPDYEDCSVCDEWLFYSNFKKWYDNNFYYIEGRKTELDKDILFKGNRIYSPLNCIFTPKRINILFVTRKSKRGLYPIGVHWSKQKRKYFSQCRDDNNKTVLIGGFNNVKDAFMAYKKYKENIIKIIAEKYKGQIPTKLYETMIRYTVSITD